MFGSIGMPELIIILTLALIIFGPRKLPELGRSLGKSLGEFKRASNELRNTLDEEIRIEEERTTAQKAATPAKPAAPAPDSGYSDPTAEPGYSDPATDPGYTAPATEPGYAETGADSRYRESDDTASDDFSNQSVPRSNAGSA